MSVAVYLNKMHKMSTYKKNG